MRELVLQILKEEGSISGVRLGEQLHISRTAVWKHITELRKLGFRIDSSPGLGYTYVHGTTLVVPDEISVNLKTRVMGRSIVYKQQVSSTQDIAERYARRGSPEGTVIIAESQSKGRGRMGRVWNSPFAEGIYWSVILRPDLKPVNIIQIPLVVGVGLVKAIIELTGLPAKIKWPNDIQIGGKKVAGILTETNCELDKVNYVIPGIGVNVNTRISNLPVELRTAATSLYEEKGEPVSRTDLVRLFLIHFEKYYFEFINHGLPPVLKQWRLHNNTIGAAVRVFDDKTELKGEAVDLDEDGFLLIKDGKGVIHKIISGDVSLRNRDKTS
jgi:BirA family transcriptional regulator, biotin operon repressor / biotin---[acetyl-CoA-carboxylase] ligase